MKKTVLGSLILGAALGVVFFTSGNEAQASEVDGVWTPRTVEQIKADINKAKDNKYTIVWGDTLSGISQATNITVQKLADINKIANVDLIYAGNTLVFDGNVVTAKNDKGETVAQSVVTPQDKNDANKPVGKQEAAKSATSSQTKGKEDSGKSTASKQAAEKKASAQGQSSVGEYGQLEGFYSKEYVEDGTKYVEAGPFKTGKDFLKWFDATYPGKGGAGFFALSGEFDETVGDYNNLVAKKAIEYVGDSSTPTESTETPAQPAQPTTPSQPAENKPAESKPTEQPSTPAEKPSTGENQGGTTTPSETPKPEKDMTPINMGNSGRVFDSEAAASEYGYAEINNENSPWYDMRFGANELLDSNYNNTGKWTVDFLENGFADE
ncbi:LysM peptidoglycan-binding domain-containing protein [Enterococcus sp. 5B3_DIV0040]|uniref:LysM peptidoglycan-binding domain-containing protein n=1 Tax=Enterococcus sp. 5B3_DIV0040 TaxID=1834182 RepID=UPI000A343F3A|nr:hypothetical protein A5883_002112 [Enterococcus sp. 5B3_DIV0040]